MKIDKYDLKAGTDLTVFEFISEGTKGAIHKLILFQQTTGTDGIYEIRVEYESNIYSPDTYRDACLTRVIRLC